MVYQLMKQDATQTQVPPSPKDVVFQWSKYANQQAATSVLGLLAVSYKFGAKFWFCS